MSIEDAVEKKPGGPMLCLGERSPMIIKYNSLFAGSRSLWTTQGDVCSDNEQDLTESHTKCYSSEELLDLLIPERPGIKSV